MKIGYARVSTADGFFRESTECDKVFTDALIVSRLTLAMLLLNISWSRYNDLKKMHNYMGILGELKCKTSANKIANNSKFS